jgi:hypothetical protein
VPRDLYTDADLAPAELRAAVLAGELYGVGDAWASISVPDLPRLRAAAVARVLPSRTAVVDRRSAAWVWGALSRAPVRPTVAVRAAVHVVPGVDVRQVRFPPGDVVTLDAVQVTTVLRTVVDLLRAPGPLRADDRDAVRAFLVGGVVSREDVGTRLRAGHKVPYSRSALRKLGSPAFADAPPGWVGSPSRH